MEIIGIAMLAAGLMGAWHVTKYAVPRTARAMGNKRRASIQAWKAEHPNAPASARWAATLGKTVAAARWGPRFLAQETRKAWREGVDQGRQKYGAQVAPAWPDLYDPNDTKNCPTCKGQVVVNGQICPDCHARQQERNRQWDEEDSDLSEDVVHHDDHTFCLKSGCPTCRPPRIGFQCPTCGEKNETFKTVEEAQAWAGEHRCKPATPRPPGSSPSPRPRSHLAVVPDSTPDNVTQVMTKFDAAPSAGTNTEGDTMSSIQTANGGEITNAEQFLAEAKAIVAEAAAEFEDASGDSNRAQEDFARIETMVASLKKQQAMSADIGAVQALMEPAQARAQAAKDRLVAAEQRLAVAKNVEAIATKHFQLIGVAAGSFYLAA